MAKKRRRAAAKQSSDDGDSSGDESASGVWELDVEELRGKLREQPVEEWRGRGEEIHACEESTRKKMDEKASAAISANGCCQCFTVHMYLAVFVVATAGLLLTAVGAAGTAPCLTPAGVFQKYQGVEECVMLRNGDLVPISKWSGDPKELCDFSCEKMEARASKEKPEPEVEPEPEPEPSGVEEGAFECEECGRRFDTQNGLNGHKANCTGPIEEGVDYAAETDAARAFLDGLDLTGPQLVDAADVGGVDGVPAKQKDRGRVMDRLLELVHGEVAGLNGARLRAKLRTVHVALATAASDAQRREAYVLARVKRVVEPVRLARKYFWENGEFQRSQCEVYVSGLQGKGKEKRGQRLRRMIKDVSGTPAPASLKSNDALETALVGAYEDKPPAVVEESKYDPLAAPEIKKVIAEHGEKLRGRANDGEVLEAVAETATRLLQQTKGGFMATNGSVVYVQTLWLLWLILDGRTVHERSTSLIFEDFKADKEGKREGYTAADGWLSAKGLEEAKRVHYNHSEKFDEARHTRGEVVFGGNGTTGHSIVCFIVEGRKYFVLFCGREDYVLVNKVTMSCLAYFASLALPVVLAETSSRPGDANYGALSSDALPRIKDILASERDEVYNRQGFRGKWKAMTGFFDGFFAKVLLAILHKGGTITEAPGRLSEVAGGVPKQGRQGSEDREDNWHFDEEQVGNLILHLRGGGSGMCGGRSGRGGRDSDDDDGAAAPTGSGPSGRGRAKRSKYDPFEGLDPWTPWNPNQVLVGVDGPGDGSGAG